MKAATQEANPFRHLKKLDEVISPRYRSPVHVTVEEGEGHVHVVAVASAPLSETKLPGTKSTGCQLKKTELIS